MENGNEMKEEGFEGRLRRRSRSRTYDVCDITSSLLLSERFTLMFDILLKCFLYKQKGPSCPNCSSTLLVIVPRRRRRRWGGVNGGVND